MLEHRGKASLVMLQKCCLHFNSLLTHLLTVVTCLLNCCYFRLYSILYLDFFHLTLLFKNSTLLKYNLCAVSCINIKGTV